MADRVLGKSFGHCECGQVAAFPSRSGGWELQPEPSERWLRARFGNEWLVDTRNALLVNEGQPVPKYFIPKTDVKFSLLTRNDTQRYDEHKGNATFYDLSLGGISVHNAVWEYENPEPESEALRGYVYVDWGAPDHWYEEEEEIYVHPRNPHKRIDAIPSSRHVQVILNGVVVADTFQPVVLFETGITPRYYIPIEDIRREYFVPTDLRTRCPYKGEASYWSALVDGKTYENVVWSYRFPIPEIPKIKGLWAFYNEKVDELIVDGQKWVAKPDQEQF